MKTKINALNIYMASDEVLSSIRSKNLDLKEEIEEKINFIENVSGKDIIIKGYDEKGVFISQYDNSKKYYFPIGILENEETQEDEEIEEKIFFNKLKMPYTLIFIILLTILFILLSFVYFNDKNKKEDIKNISNIDLIYNEIKLIDDNIAKELNIQKEARKIEKESVKKVIEYENIQKEIRLKALNLSNDL